MTEPKAATVLSPSHNATLTNLASKESSKPAKRTSKNILCQGTIEWPRPDKAVEDDILAKLMLILKNDGKILRAQQTSEDQAEDLTKSRSQVAIGVSSVFRCLEKDSLACVLVSGQASPAVTVDHVISLAHERGCPLLCLDGLSPSVAMATNSKCTPLALGFKNVEDNSGAIFAEVIDLVKANTRVVKRTSSSTASENSSRRKVLENFGRKTNGLKPITVDKDSQRKILDELQRVFTLAKLTQPSVQKVKKKEKKTRKKKKKSHILKETVLQSCRQQYGEGKRSVEYFLNEGKLLYILASDTISEHLTTEAATSSSSLLDAASRQACPVVTVAGLTEMLASILKIGFSVIGIKKRTAFPNCNHHHFQGTVELMEKLLPSHAQPQPLGVQPVPSNKTSQNAETHPRKGRLQTQQQTEEEEDFSYLYVSKKDSKDYQEMLRKRKADAENAKKELTFSSDFISLGSEGSSRTEVKDFVKSNQKPCTKKERRERKQHGGSDFISLQTVPSKDVTDMIGQGSEDQVATSALFFMDKKGKEQEDYKNADKQKIGVLDSTSALFYVDKRGKPRDFKDTAEQDAVETSTSTLFCVDKKGNGQKDSTVAVGAQGGDWHLQGDSTSLSFVIGAEGDVSQRASGVSESGSGISASSQATLFSVDRTGNSKGIEEKVPEGISNVAKHSSESLEGKRSVSSVDMETEVTKQERDMHVCKEETAQPPQTIPLVPSDSENTLRSESAEKSVLVDVSPHDQTQPSAGQFVVQRSASKVLPKGTKSVAPVKDEIGTVLGDTELSGSDTSLNVLAIHQPRQKGQGSKRKAETQDGFISLTYTEANIHTMVANPNKKKKKKKKKN